MYLTACFIPLRWRLPISCVAEGKKAYVVGEGALIHELYKAGFTITDVNPDFVIVGETRSYNWDMMHKAAYFVANGARFIATNPDTHGRGFYPACGALCAGIEKISGANRSMLVSPARGSSAQH